MEGNGGEEGIDNRKVGENECLLTPLVLLQKQHITL